MRYDALRQSNTRRKKEMTTELDQIADSAGETATTVAEVAFGAAQTVREVASDPMGTARKQVKGLERKGTPAARKVNRRFNARLNAATAPAKDVAKNINARFTKAAKQAEKVASDLMPERITVLGVEVNGKLPEKVVIRGFELVKLQARRRDVVGGVAKRRENDDGLVGPELQEFDEKIAAVQLRHQEIEDDEVIATVERRLQAGLRIGGLLHVEAHASVVDG
jgi:ElaB/YqjD/DUF883 family membrane-anchored ribosome-binding protein